MTPSHPNHNSLRHFRFLGCLLFILLPAAASAGEANVARLIESPEPGTQPPVVWYRNDPGLNSGSGAPSLLAKSGGELGARIANPWGGEDAAFGPSGEPLTGAAVAGSKEANLLGGTQGTALLFLKVPEAAVEEGIIFEQGEWKSASECFDLRIFKGTELQIMARGAAETGAPQRFALDKVEPGKWYFLALRWEKQSDDYAVNWWLGELAAGSTLLQGELRLPTVGTPGSPLRIAGRSRYELTDIPVVLKGGFLNNLAIYDSPLSDKAISAIYSAATEGLK